MMPPPGTAPGHWRDYTHVPCSGRCLAFLFEQRVHRLFMGVSGLRGQQSREHFHLPQLASDAFNTRGVRVREVDSPLARDSAVPDTRRPLPG